MLSHEWIKHIICRSCKCSQRKCITKYKLTYWFLVHMLTENIILEGNFIGVGAHIRKAQNYIKRYIQGAGVTEGGEFMWGVRRYVCWGLHIWQYWHHQARNRGTIWQYWNHLASEACFNANCRWYNVLIIKVVTCTPRFGNGGALQC